MLSPEIHREVTERFRCRSKENEAYFRGMVDCMHAFQRDELEDLATLLEALGKVPAS